MRLLLTILELPFEGGIVPRSDDPNYNCDKCIKYFEQKRLLSQEMITTNTNDLKHKLKSFYCDCKNFSSICKKSVHFSSTKYRDILIKLALMCENASLTTFVDSTDDLDILIQEYNPIVEELFGTALIET